MLMPKSRLFCLRLSVWPFLFTFNGKSIFLTFKKYVCLYIDRESLCLRFPFLRIAHEVISFHKLNRRTAVFFCLPLRVYLLNRPAVQLVVQCRSGYSYCACYLRFRHSLPKQYFNLCTLFPRQVLEFSLSLRYAVLES